MSDETYISDPLVLGNDEDLIWVGGPTEVICTIVEALHAVDTLLVDVRDIDMLRAEKVWMVPNRHDGEGESCPYGSASECGCWRVTGDSKTEGAAQFWQLEVAA